MFWDWEIRLSIRKRFAGNLSDLNFGFALFSKEDLLPTVRPNSFCPLDFCDFWREETSRRLNVASCLSLSSSCSSCLANGRLQGSRMARPFLVSCYAKRRQFLFGGTRRADATVRLQSSCPFSIVWANVATFRRCFGRSRPRVSPGKPPSSSSACGKRVRRRDARSSESIWIWRKKWWVMVSGQTDNWLKGIRIKKPS